MNSKSIKILAYLSLSFLLFACSDSEREIYTENNYELIKLPDGSSAFLNHNSSIRFDYAFERRSITQTGEVFYSVKKKKYTFYN